MGLVGRDHELAVIDGAIAAVANGSPRVVTIVGEPGIGKTALLQDVLERASGASLAAVAVRAAERDMDVPFGLVLDVFATLVSVLHPRHAAEVQTSIDAVFPHGGSSTIEDLRPAERFRLHRAIRELIEDTARREPLALLLDDLQWADPGSLELLLHMLHRAPRAPLLLAAAIRPGVCADRILEAVEPAFDHDHLALGPLDLDAAEAMIADAVSDERLRIRLVAEASGHPLYLRELARATRRGEAELPATISAAVALEVARLDDDARAMADGAAVAGDPFDTELAAIAAGLSPPAAARALDTLVAADLVRPARHQPRFAFRHPLVHRAAYDAAPPAWRISAHKRVAERLAERGADPITRAYHVARSALPADEEAIALLLEAAEEAARVAPDAAVHWRTAALALVPGDDLARRAALLAALATDQLDAGLLSDCRASLLQALALAPDDLALTAACASVEQFLGASAQARRRLTAVVARATPKQRPSVELELAAAAYFAYDPEALLAHASAARALPGAAGAAATGLAGVGHLWLLDRAAADVQLDTAAEAFAALDDEALAAYPQAAIYLGVAQCLAERLKSGIATLHRGVDVVRSARGGGLLPVLLFVRGMMRVHVLEIDAAISDLEAAEESARLLGLVTVEQWTLSALAGACYERGDPAEMARAVAAFERVADAAETTYASITARCNVGATRLLTDPERCISEMVAAGGAELEHVDPTWSSWQLRVLVRAAVAADRLEDAERWAALATQRAHDRELPVGAARAVSTRTEVLLARSEHLAAVAAAREALMLARRTESAYEALEGELLLGRVLAAAGETQEATEVLQQVADRAATVSALRVRDAAAQELRGLGVRVPGSGRRGTDGSRSLSPREQEIAELVAQGRSNREVATALFLSEKTVEYHLSNVYAKLGVRSRVELAGAFTA